MKACFSLQVLLPITGAYLFCSHCLGFRDQIQPFLDCVKEGNVELVKEHLSRGEQVEISITLCPSLLTSS
jgi:hypothetical protein